MKALEQNSTSKDFDALLLLRFANGEIDAFGEIFDRYHKSIYRFIYFRVGFEETAQDLTSIVFTKLLERLSQSKLSFLSFHLRGYLYQIARNVIVDYYRSKDKEELPLIYNEEEVSFISEKRLMDKAVSNAELEYSLKSLPPDIREVVILRYIEDLSIKEVAKIVDKTPEAVRVIIHRALKRLQSNS
jgi:RNA polymerase sigma-70 factor (ECF subfamily)